MIPLTPDRARSIAFSLAVLSLDLARGTLAPMGLDVPDEDAFRLALHGEPLGPAIGDAGVARVTGTLHALEARFGVPFVARLVAWIEGEFLGPTDPQVFLWRCVVGTRGDDGPPSLVKGIREELADAQGAPPPEVPQSTRDIGLLVAHGFPTRPLQGEMEASPMTLVADHLAARAFVAAWDRALAREPAKEAAIDATFAWGKREGARAGFHALERPGAFQRPAPA